jgi:uncharacterized protein YecT (DUF1311 family)
MLKRRVFLGLQSALPALVALAFEIALPAHAAPTDAYSRCMERANSTVDMQTCQQAGLLDANRRLAIALAKTLAALPPDQREKLSEAQQRWTDFRQSDCRVFYGKSAGSVATVRGGSCMIERTESRIGELTIFARH